MKAITILLAALAIGLIPATLSAQATSNEPVNYFAEFADLMHGEMDTKPALVAAATTNRFPAFVHYREVVQGKVEGFLTYHEKLAVTSVPPAHSVFANWVVGQGCPHDAMTADFAAFSPRPVEDCSGR